MHINAARDAGPAAVAVARAEAFARGGNSTVFARPKWTNLWPISQGGTRPVRLTHKGRSTIVGQLLHAFC